MSRFDTFSMTPFPVSRFDTFSKQIKEKFFLKYNIAQADGTGRSFEVYRNNDETVSETYQPNHEGKILLAKYYQNKYGILIFNISDRQDCQNLIKYVSDNKENFKVGVLLPSAMEGQPRQDSALEKYNRDTSSRSHCCPVIIESFGAKNLRIIDLDCIARTPSQNSNFLALLNNVAPAEMYVTASSNVMDTNSCHTYAISILKDALRIDDLAKQITLTSGAIQFETTNSAGLASKIHHYQKLPTPLLKLVQSKSYLRTDELVGTEEPTLQTNNF